MHSLPLFHRIAGSRVVVVGEGEMAEAKARLVGRSGGTPCAETEAHHAKLAFVALEDEKAARAAAMRLKRAGLLVNVADMPELCDFTLPSIMEREPVLVAISTGGASAGLAKHLRLRLERLVPQSIGQLADKLQQAREAMRARWADGGDRRRAVDEALAEGGVLDVLGEQSHENVDTWLSNGSVQSGSRTEDFTLNSDDPEDLTLRQARLLGMADRVIHDPATPEAILIRARADAERLVLPAEPLDNGLTVILRREG